MSRYTSTLTLRVVVVLSGICVMITATPTHSKDDEAQPRGFQDPYFKSLEFGKSLVKARIDDELIAVSFDELPRELQAQMYSYLAFSIQWDAHPQKRGWPYQDGVAVYHKRGDFDVRVFAAYDRSQDDLIEYSWRRFGQNLRIVAALNAMRLEIRLDEVRQNPKLNEHGDDVVDRTKGLVSRVIRFSGKDMNREPFEMQDLPWPDRFDEGTTFCSDPSVNIRRLMRWHTRVDGFVHDGVLTLLIYKRRPQSGGCGDGSKWFDDDFRALIHEKAREQGKVPPKGPASEE